LRKLNESSWAGGIFAAAGLKRINLDHHISQYLDWMVPAPAQGAMAVMIREDDRENDEITGLLNHPETELCTGIERDLLNEMEAGCSAPVGAFAWIEGDQLILHAVALNADGSVQYDIEKSAPVNRSENVGREAAKELLSQGAGRLIEDLRK
jgi:hydroxymethylbilane synthase